MRTHRLPGHPRIIVTFRWWERPHWLWARRAEGRTAGYLTAMRERLSHPGGAGPFG